MSRFVCTHARVKIRKASKIKKPVVYKKNLTLSNKYQAAVQVHLVNGLKKFKKRINADDLHRAWQRQDFSAVINAVPWDKLPQDINPGFLKLKDAMLAASATTIAHLPAPVQHHLRFDTSNPRLRNHIETKTANLVREITHDAKESIRQSIHRSFDKAMTPRQVAMEIKGSIGLYPKLEKAVANYKAGLQAAGKSDAYVEKMTSRYYDKMLDYRAMTIARTEARSAINRGQLAVWHQAAANGLIDRDKATKVWIVDGDPCPICLPMDGEEVGLYENWTLEDGSSVEYPPEDVHPNCFCGMTLNTGDSEEED